ncbi:MAG: hypothetical protein RJQ14_02960 [Marinoscillum sp.]
MKFKSDGYTEKKFNHAEKKIFIEHFFVNYQKVMISYAKASGGVGYGSASASLALGLEEIEDDQLQQMTNRYYKNFTAQLEAKGFSILTPEEAIKYKYLQGSDLNPGGKPSMDALAPGYLTTLPEGYTQIAKKSNPFDFAGVSVSNSMEGMIVARVNITVPFAVSQDINGGPVGGVAKIKAQADLRLSPSESVPVQGDFKKPKTCMTKITFAYKKSLKWQAFYDGDLKTPLEIEGVLDEDTKYKSTSVSNSSSSLWIQDAYSDNVVMVPCDADKYEKGVDMAVNQYMNAALEGFLENID